MARWYLGLGWIAAAVCAAGGATDPIGLEALRVVNPALVGTGIRVSQVEAGNPTWEVNPLAVGQPESLFTWIASAGSAQSFPNALGSESGHANQVGDQFYGHINGLAPGLAHVDNYEAGHFYSLIQNQTVTPGLVANQSFIFALPSIVVDRDYDNYAARYGTLFVSGAGNSGSPSSPSTAYNGLCVAASLGSSSIGPTTDGRSKPDLTAPASQTSFSTPQVAGAAALLMQAASNGVAGAGTTVSAADYRTIKALLMNGASKPADWTNGVSTPLDARYGAGVLHVFDSYRQLRGGRHEFNTTASYATGAAHPPPSDPNNLPARRGWDFNSLSSTLTQDRANHYAFALTGSAGQVFRLRATLVWPKQLNKTTINDLDLFLFEADTGALVASSRSLVDNVEHLFVQGLLPGRYVLQVLKYGGVTQRASTSEIYALAFDFGPPADARLEGSTYSVGGFQSTLVGEPFAAYVIESRTETGAWTPVTTNTTGQAGFFNFSDPTAVGDSHRFYRSRLAP